MQIPLPLELTNNFNPNRRAGFRLERFEVLNWGTFDQSPQVLDLKGEMALLTGENGSGKSTLVDGLLTLLVPNKRRNYNQASSATGKRERDEKSYIQGAYGRTRLEDSYGSKPKYLREKGIPSVLLAYFCDRTQKQDVTLAQVLWIQDSSVQKFFVIADAELSISSHFCQCTRIPDLKKCLKDIGAEIFDEFIKYSQQFRKRLGLQSEKALDLFNQTVSIKEIGGLNEFVRNHMLEKTEVKTNIEELKKYYDDLIICQNSIKNARKQLEALVPLQAEVEKYKNLQEEVAEIQKNQKILPAFFASQKIKLLIQELQRVEQELTQEENYKKEIERLQEQLSKTADSLKSAIDKNNEGQRLRELEREIDQLHKEVESKKSKVKTYNSLAQQLNLPEYKDSNTFYEARIQGEKLKQNIDTALQSLQAQRDEKIMSRSALNNEQNNLNDELKSLRSRKSNIDPNNLRIREDLARNLNLDETELPFVGELLQVYPEEQKWQGAIERLLKNFGLSVLVPEPYHQAVDAYVHRTHLKGRLVYYHVTASTLNPTQRPCDRNQVPYKLEIKPDYTFSQWLRERLVREFSYICCDTVEEFQHQTRPAITQNGLIKQSKERHEKDDRYKIDDRRQYILGWNNLDKIKTLEAELKQVNHELDQLNQEIQFLERQSKQYDSQKSALQHFMNFSNFTEIDWKTSESSYLKLQAEKQQLEASSDGLKQLQAELKATQQEIVQANQKNEICIKKITILESEQTNYKEQQNNCEAKLRAVDVTDRESFAKSQESKLRKYSMTLTTIDQDEINLRDSLQEKLRQREQQQNTSRNSLTMQMWNFKNNFPETTSELGTSLDFLEEYLKLKAKIEHDDLPRNEQRFQESMNGKITEEVAFFKADLEQQEADIKENIDELNNALRQIDYTSSTYIELCYDPTRNSEIRDFRENLKRCLGNVASQSQEDNEKRFAEIEKYLIEPFKSQERWTNLVTDVRNWLEFSVSERYRSDNSEKEHHTDSSGKSGGQKAKLAYTILASAIAYQFGLTQYSSKTKSFRFVVIDEAFSKSDDKNARYAMELFKNLNLQLVVVTPKDKIHVIEPYIYSLHFVYNNDQGNSSKIVSIPAEEYRKNVKLS